MKLRITSTFLDIVTFNRSSQRRLLINVLLYYLRHLSQHIPVYSSEIVYFRQKYCNMQHIQGDQKFPVHLMITVQKTQKYVNPWPTELTL
jgi:hypothetical protein